MPTVSRSPKNAFGEPRRNSTVSSAVAVTSANPVKSAAKGDAAAGSSTRW